MTSVVFFLQRQSYLTLSLIALLSLSGCGGGGGGSNGNSFVQASKDLSTNASASTTTLSSAPSSSSALTSSSDAPAISSTGLSEQASSTASSYSYESNSSKSSETVNNSSSSITSLSSSSNAEAKSQSSQAISESSVSSSSLTVSSSKSSAKSSQASSIKSSSSSKAAPFIDKAPPTPVAQITIESTGSDYVHLSWTPTTDNVGVSGYRIYRDFVQIDKVDAFTFDYVDYDVAPGKIYTYGISAGDDANNWTSLTTTTAQTTLPSSSSSSKASSIASTSSSTLSSANNTSSSSKGSSISSSTSSSPSSAKSSSSLSVSSVSSSKAASSIDNIAPSAPLSVNKDAVLSNRVDISWPSATDNVGVVNYRVYRDNTIIATLDASLQKYSDTSVYPNKMYSFSVSAGDGAGNWSSLKTIFVTTPSQGGTGVQLYWNHPSLRENLAFLPTQAIGGYQIRYRLNGSRDFTTINIQGNSTTSYSIADAPKDAIFEIACFDTNNLYGEFASILPY